MKEKVKQYAVDETQKCKNCGVEKPITDFPMTSTRGVKGGTTLFRYARRTCKPCFKVAMAERFQRRKEAWRPNRERWYVKNWQSAKYSKTMACARKRGATEFMSKEEWAALIQQKHCHWCGMELHLSFTHADHVRPLVWGGQHTADNVVLSCANCNQRREWERKIKHRPEGIAVYKTRKRSKKA